ncbi:hypothetical protein XENOCAPTIV_025526 [Xenoophorus captivus]|uniref:Transmembrane protein n=1 Tax=Xenoophorus captivus TaxID=1517983 RepID=A0ABV0R4T5_9TELE
MEVNGSQHMVLTTYSKTRVCVCVCVCVGGCVWLIAIFLLLASCMLYNDGALGLTVICFVLAIVRTPLVCFFVFVMCAFAGFPLEHIKLRKYVCTCGPRV